MEEVEGMRGRMRGLEWGVFVEGVAVDFMTLAWEGAFTDFMGRSLVILEEIV